MADCKNCPDCIRLNTCGICNCSIINIPCESNQNMRIDSECKCKFCVKCLEWIHNMTPPSSYRLYKIFCRRCNGDITTLVKYGCLKNCEWYHSDNEEKEEDNIPTCNNEKNRKKREKKKKAKQAKKSNITPYPIPNISMYDAIDPPL